MLLKTDSEPSSGGEQHTLNTYVCWVVGWHYTHNIVQSLENVPGGQVRV